ncbi:MAG: hypothetical protein GC192_17095 [Bacteroidetes bacterium]|nr:hypothetical protein [Bacteroidota bacterium]
MKTNILLFALLLCAPAIAQTDYGRADAFATNFNEPYADMADLAQKLTAPFQSEEERARVLFIWIAQNISYDCKKFHNPTRHSVSAQSKEELLRKRQEVEAKEMAKSFKAKKGVCADYSQIFKAMCDAVGLEAVVVTGDARDFHRPYRNNQNNSHAWNAVKIDGQWRLMDATWAAGYVNPEVTKFTRKLFPGFFMTDPAWFVQSHFPDDEQWQLLETPINKKTFPDQPLINFGQEDYPLLGFSIAPQKTANGKGYELRFQFANTPKAFMVTTFNSKQIGFETREEDGWVVLSFTQKPREITVFAGESPRQHMSWLARYELK